MENDPEFYVSPEDLEAQLKADEKGKSTEEVLGELFFFHFFFSLHSPTNGQGGVHRSGFSSQKSVSVDRADFRVDVCFICWFMLCSAVLVRVWRIAIGLTLIYEVDQCKFCVILNRVISVNCYDFVCFLPSFRRYNRYLRVSHPVCFTLIILCKSFHPPVLNIYCVALFSQKKKKKTHTHI